MAASDALFIVITGRQTHGAQPWGGVDPIVVASQVVLGLQTIASRQINVTNQPAIITVGSLHGGNRGNIIPDSVGPGRHGAHLRRGYAQGHQGPDPPHR
jgi:amidohydrolase